jgi:hypothetical protein
MGRICCLPDNLSTAEASIVRRASMLELQMEMLETKFAANDGEASADQLLLYQRTASSARRLFESVGIKRRARDITPTLDEYLASKYSGVIDETANAAKTEA